MPDLIADMLRDCRLARKDEAVAREWLLHRASAGDPVEADVLHWVSERYEVRFSDLADESPDPRLLARFPAGLLTQHRLLPLCERNQGVEIATSRLFDRAGLDALRVWTGCDPIPVLAPSEAIEHHLKALLGVGADTIDSLDKASFLQVVEEETGGLDLDDASQDASIIRFVNQILVDAIRQRSTDVHLEPFEHAFRVRYRVDGVLQDIPVPAQLKRYQPAVVSRIKILSDLDIAEKRLPQDGRIKLRFGGTDVDVRVSVIPMIHGEAVVLRLLRQDTALLQLDELGLAPVDDRGLRHLLQLPHGIILVTGPTGSGKTTTLYAALQTINDSLRKIITVEDPVEYQLDGINQIQVSEKTGLTFARGLRSILRHDPDVILIGEIRDTETATIAVQASLTGHLVFSTLHTNDSPGALTRLIDMGVAPYLVASSVEAVLAQRLVRLLCPTCKRLMSAADYGVLPAVVKDACGPQVFAAVGCSDCRHTGYYGRHAVFELLQMTDDIRHLAQMSHAVGDIRASARSNGWRPLCEDGWRLVKAGLTTPAEVLRVTRDTRDPGGDETPREAAIPGERP